MIRIQPGLPEDTFDAAAALYWEAFGGKLGKVMGPSEKGVAYVRRVLDPSHAICALGANNELLGVVGFKTSQSAMVGGTFRDLSAIYGVFGATWRAVCLSLLERDVENEHFLMDGIFVSPNARGQGVGTTLMQAIKDEGRARGYDSLRLDVINTNPRARALYERLGFQADQVQHLGPLRHIFQFDSATTMICDLTEAL